MRPRVRVAVRTAALACAAVLVACGPTPAVVRGDAAPAAAPTPAGPSARGADIALIDVPEPARLVVAIVGHPDAEGTQTRRMFYQNEVRIAGSKLTSALQPEALRPGAAATAALTAAFHGSVVHVADPQQGREDLLDDYYKVVTTAARDLDVVPAAVGYWTTYPNGPYRPWVVLSYRLRDNATGAVIQSGLIGSGPPPGEDKLASVAPDDRFSFPTFAALTAEPQRAVEGLRATVTKVAEALAARM